MESCKFNYCYPGVVLAVNLSGTYDVGFGIDDEEELFEETGFESGSIAIFKRKVS